MHSVAKWNQSFQDFAYGMRCHFGVDATLGLVHSVVSTAANLPELSTDAERLHGDEKIVVGDSAISALRNARNSRTVRSSSGSP